MQHVGRVEPRDRGDAEVGAAERDPPREHAGRERPRGDIVMISSADLGSMRAGGAAYNMAKAALEALALTLAKEEIRLKRPGDFVTVADEISEQRLASGLAGSARTVATAARYSCSLTVK